MLRKSKEGIDWLEFDLLQAFPHVVHGVFLRHGGASTGEFSSLNMGGSTGDDKESIKNNREKVQHLLSLKELVSSYQVHGDRVAFVPEDRHLDAGCDGMITSEKNIGLMIKHADCQAAIFFDPLHNAVACVHSGWRGSVQNIYKKTIEAMKAKIGTRPSDLLVCISPSLGPDHAEFIHYKEELPPSFWEFQTRPTYFNFWEISRWQLKEEGVLDHHIEMAQICTYANTSDFFSYRKEKITGRNATVVAVF